MVNQTPHLTR